MSRVASILFLGSLTFMVLRPFHYGTLFKILIPFQMLSGRDLRIFMSYCRCPYRH